MTDPKVGLITFGDNRAHEWEQVFKGMTESRHQQAIGYFKRLPIAVHASGQVARQREEIDAQVDALRAVGVEAFVAHTPCWTSPNLVVRGIQRMGLPTVVLTNKSSATHGTVGFLGTCGTLDQIGYSHLRVRGDFDGADTGAVAEKTLPYFRAAAVKARLRGKVFGLFGGRSLGIDTGTFDPLQWKRMFEVDTEHIDQLEIIRRAELVPEEQTAHMLNWLEQNVAQVNYGQGKLTPEKLAFQVRCYLATKEIIAEKGLDFVAVKCMPDLTTYYVPQCISAAFLPGPYDADGAKEPMMIACEADGDAALTMEILKQVAGGKPVLFMDVSYIDDEAQVFYMPNCGAFCSWYAKRSDNTAENLKQVELRAANRPGGGAITYFTPSPGPLTFARLYRKRGEYYMAIVAGETVELPSEKYAAFVQARGSHPLPTAFVKLEVDIDAFIGEFASNHILAVDGLYVRELEHVCHMLDITPVVFQRQAEKVARRCPPSIPPKGGGKPVLPPLGGVRGGQGPSAHLHRVLLFPIGLSTRGRRMNPRERFEAVVNHREPDRVPVDLGRHVGSLHRLSYAKLAEYLADPDLKNHDKILDRMVQNVFPDEKLLRRFNVDFRWLVPNWVGVQDVEGEDAYRDMWGIKWAYMLDSYSLVESPLENVGIDDLEHYAWPDPYDPQMFAGLREQAKYWYENTDYVIVADSIKGGLLTKALQIRGYEAFFSDLARDIPYAEALLDKLLWLYKEMWTQYMKEVGPYVQVVHFTDDIGAQNSMMISPATFRSLLKPRLKELIEHIKSLADVKFMYHTDGSVAPVIDDIIEIGVDILNPIQTSAMGMDTYVLKETYGDRLCFHGAIDVQQMLPFSTPEEVRYDVARRIYDLGRGGGFILSPCHNIGADVSPENILALFDAAQELGRYPLQMETVLKPEDLNPVIAAPEEKPVTKKRPRRRR